MLDNNVYFTLQKNHSIMLWFFICLLYQLYSLPVLGTSKMVIPSSTVMVV